jgi:hypothetical protein
MKEKMRSQLGIKRIEWKEGREKRQRVKGERKK